MAKPFKRQMFTYEEIAAWLLSLQDDGNYNGPVHGYENCLLLEELADAVRSEVSGINQFINERRTLRAQKRNRTQNVIEPEDGNE